MPTIAGELRTSTEDPQECEDLVGFSCGDGRLAAEGAIERIVSSCRTGKLPDATLRVTREMPQGALVGVTAIEWPGLVLRNPLLNGDAFADAAYIAVLSLVEEYRGGYRTQEGEPLSHVLMKDALDYIDSDTASEMPPVQAIIDPQNAPSRSLCEHFGFIQPIMTEPDLWYVRPRGLPLEEPSPEEVEDEEADE
ncbi:MAG TPA: hypothetical protein VGR07_05725 [Thermoanaerobaculia bacterium]|jgi:hypothetical protein|nr:hypothetical protein [Thermoanaerobaculia bacterium]